MTTRPRRHHDRKPGPAGVPRHTSGSRPPGDATTAAASQAGRDAPSGRLASVKAGRRRLITRQHLRQFPGIAS
jgi:hypothetical protein